MILEYNIKCCPRQNGSCKDILETWKSFITWVSHFLTLAFSLILELVQDVVISIVVTSFIKASRN